MTSNIKTHEIRLSNYRKIQCPKCTRKQAQLSLNSNLKNNQIKKSESSNSNQEKKELSKNVYLISWYSSLRQDEKWINLRKDLDDRQANEFILWINSKLEDTIYNSVCIKDLYIDLNDGLRILYLLEILYNCILIKEKYKTRLHKIKNFQSCIDYMELERKVKCVGINSTELADGNKKILLGLLFLIRHDFEYNYLRKTLSDIKNDISKHQDVDFGIDKFESKASNNSNKFVQSIVKKNEIGLITTSSKEHIDTIHPFKLSKSSLNSSSNTSSSIVLDHDINNNLELIKFTTSASQRSINHSYNDITKSEHGSSNYLDEIKHNSSQEPNFYTNLSFGNSNCDSFSNQSQTDSLQQIMDKITIATKGSFNSINKDDLTKSFGSSDNLDVKEIKSFIFNVPNSEMDTLEFVEIDNTNDLNSIGNDLSVINEDKENQMSESVKNISLENLITETKDEGEGNLENVEKITDCDPEKKDQEVFSEKKESDTEIIEVNYSIESEKIQLFENCSSIEICLDQQLISMEMCKNEELVPIDPVEVEIIEIKTQFKNMEKKIEEYEHECLSIVPQSILNKSEELNEIDQAVPIHDINLDNLNQKLFVYDMITLPVDPIIEENAEVILSEENLDMEILDYEFSVNEDENFKHLETNLSIKIQSNDFENESTCIIARKESIPEEKIDFQQICESNESIFESKETNIENLNESNIEIQEDGQEPVVSTQLDINLITEYEILNKQPIIDITYEPLVEKNLLNQDDDELNTSHSCSIDEAVIQQVVDNLEDKSNCLEINSIIQMVDSTIENKEKHLDRLVEVQTNSSKHEVMNQEQTLKTPDIEILTETSESKNVIENLNIPEKEILKENPEKFDMKPVNVKKIHDNNAGNKKFQAKQDLADKKINSLDMNSNEYKEPTQTEKSYKSIVENGVTMNAMVNVSKSNSGLKSEIKKEKHEAKQSKAKKNKETQVKSEIPRKNSIIDSNNEVKKIADSVEPKHIDDKKTAEKVKKSVVNVAKFPKNENTDNVEKAVEKDSSMRKRKENGEMRQKSEENGKLNMKASNEKRSNLLYSNLNGKQEVIKVSSRSIYMKSILSYSIVIFILIVIAYLLINEHF